MRDARAQLREGKPELRELLRRARAASELADRVFDSYEPLHWSRGKGFAADLYRQSVFWSLSVLRGDEAEGEESFEGLWRLAAPIEELKLPDEPDARDELERLFVADDFRVFANLSDADQHRVATNFRILAHSALQLSEPAAHAVRELLFQRFVRVAGFVLLLVVLTGLSVFAAQLALRKPNLAAGKPWKTSSVWAECKPELRLCGSLHSDIFFHTKEDQSPWIEFDLGKPTRVSEVFVKNRSDAVPDRAVPLIVELSNDAKKWREVVRRDTTFSRWTGTFPPQEARYVRLRVGKRTQFHLEAVEIRP